MEPTKITVAEVKKQMERGEPVVFLDTRNPKAWAASAVKLPGALRVPADEVERQLSAIPHGRPLVTYCT
jgi:rhodanese-related sulfurtransferase